MTGDQADNLIKSGRVRLRLPGWESGRWIWATGVNGNALMSIAGPVSSQVRIDIFVHEPDAEIEADELLHWLRVRGGYQSRIIREGADVR